MKKTRIAAFLLAIAVCLPLLASCSKGPDIAQRPDGQDGPAQDDSGDFVSANYNQEDFKFLVITHSNKGRDYYGGPYIDADTYTGGKINDGVHERNLAVEEKYKVIVEKREEFNDDAPKLLQQLYMAGDINFDVIYGWGYKLGSCITENYFTDFNQLENVDLTKEYWSPSAMEDLTIDGKLYLCINDISMNKIDWADMLFYNKDLADRYNVEKTFGSPYDLVRSGKWTLDTFLKMISSMSHDVDGDGSITKDDVYGLIDGSADGSFALTASGIFYTNKLEDGSYELNIYSEKVLKIIDTVTEVLSNNKYVKNYAEIWTDADMTGYDDQWEYARSFFATGHALFCTASANITNENAFRNMKDTYGILPMPKYDENQAQYYSNNTSLASMFAIPSTVRSDVSTASLERTGTILEYMAYKSSEILLPKYYDEVLKGQRLDNADDQEMLDLIRNTVRYQFADMVGLEDIGKVVNAMFTKPSTASSTYKRNEKKLTKQLDEFYTKVIKLG